MKLKKSFITHTIAGTQIMVPVGQSVHAFNGFVRSNETAAFLVDQLRQNTTEEKLADALMAQYDVEPKQAEEAVAYVLSRLRSIDALE